MKDRWCRRAALPLLAVAALALSACGDDEGPPVGPTAGGPTGDGVESPTGEPSESEDPAPATGATGGSGATGLVEAQNLCEVLDAGELSRATGMRLGEGAFDGVQCIWMAENEVGSLAMSLGKGENTARYIEELQELDVGEDVEVPGTEDAAVVTITSGSGSNRSNRVALVAKIGNERLTVILTGRDASLDRLLEVAALVTQS
jgi:hypothetical protein